MCFDVRKKEAGPLLDAALGVMPEPEPAASEDRGTPVWIWDGADGDLFFCGGCGATHRYEVSVPIGWTLRPHPELGVVLANVLGLRMHPAEALFHAWRSQMGFRLRGHREVRL